MSGRGAGLRLVDGGTRRIQILPERAAENATNSNTPRKCDVRIVFTGLGAQAPGGNATALRQIKSADRSCPFAEQHVQMLGAAQRRGYLVDNGSRKYSR